MNVFSARRFPIEFKYRQRFCSNQIKTQQTSWITINVAKEYNIKCAKYGLQKCREKYPLGGLNQETVMQNNTKSDSQINNFNLQLHLLAVYRMILRYQFGKKIPLSDKEQQQKEFIESILQGGFCCELSHLTRNIILARYPDISIESAELDDHEFLVIGRHTNSNPNDINTWGDSTIICDPWSNMVYPASEFRQIQQNTSDIPMYGMFKKDYHYLTGDPKIYSPTE